MNHIKATEGFKLRLWITHGDECSFFLFFRLLQRMNYSFLRKYSFADFEQLRKINKWILRQSNIN